MAETARPHGKRQAYHLRIAGLVQGVGFRPMVWQVAQDLGLCGSVLNDGAGVLVEIWATEPELEIFRQNLEQACPPLARIDGIKTRLAEEGGAASSAPDDFSIRMSEANAIRTGIVPDAATCPACLAETMDTGNRRYRYPFTNCTHCGPRLSIIRALPYDRAQTSMASFPMCPACQAEYDNPADRRFHAQPNACPDCGPRLSLVGPEGEKLPQPDSQPDTLPDSADEISRTAALLKEGKIVAIKGIGGFHLAVDASNETAVEELRRRKARYGKPLALMARDIAMVRHYCQLDELGEALLTDRAAPIVLLERKERLMPPVPTLASGIATDQRRLGLMLPYSPLHAVLMAQMNAPLVMTSGNRSHEPQAIGNEEALARLADLADAFLLHNREIVNRLDDSVVQIVGGSPALLRRARGFAPDPLPLPAGFDTAPPLLAIGGEIKNTFCLLDHGQATLSHHIGDMENPSVQSDCCTALALYSGVRDFTPQRLAIDCHQSYFSARLGERLAAEQGCVLDRIQHHHAHVAACLAEHGVARKAKACLAIVLDGLGAAEDGSLWGGEFLRADYAGYERLAHFAPIAMLGGSKASYEPWRNLYAHLRALGPWDQLRADYPDVELFDWFETIQRAPLDVMLERGLNAPKASSAGRLFDAVAAALDLCRARVRFEGEAAMQLQALAEQAFAAPHAEALMPYAIDCLEQEGAGEDEGISLSWGPLWQAILKDLQQGESKPVIAARFHLSLIGQMSVLAHKLARQQGLETIVLTGGVFQNALLCEGVSKALSDLGYEILLPQKFPANDGGLALGQALISAARALEDAP